MLVRRKRALSAAEKETAAAIREVLCKVPQAFSPSAGPMAPVAEKAAETLVRKGHTAAALKDALMFYVRRELSSDRAVMAAISDTLLAITEARRQFLWDERIRRRAKDNTREK